MQIDHHGYTFAYDDVKPNMSSPDAEVSGTLSTEGVRVLRIVVGGLDSNDGQQTQPSDYPEVSYGGQASSATAQSSSVEYTSTQSTESSTIAADPSSGSDASTYATRSPDALATSATSTTSASQATSAEPASLETLTTQAPSTMITLPSTTSAHPGDSPTAYSPLGGETKNHGNIVTVIETAVVTTVVTKTTTVLE